MEEEFLIQEKGESVLKQGQAVGLTRTRDNIHQIEAELQNECPVI